MVTTAIRKCQSKKHSGGGCDDPKCPEKVAYTAMLDKSVKTLNFDSFSKAKSKLDEKTTAQHIDSLMRKTGHVEPSRVAETNRQVAMLTKLEDEYEQILTDGGREMKEYDRNYQSYVQAINVKSSATLEMRDSNNKINGLERQLEELNDDKKSYQKEIDGHNNIINDLSRDPLRVLKRKKTEDAVNLQMSKILAVGEEMHKLQGVINEKERLLSNEVHTLARNRKAHIDSRIIIDRHEPIVRIDEKRFSEAHTKMASIQKKHNELRKETLIGFKKINAGSIPRSAKNTPEFRAILKDENKNPLKSHSALNEYNKKVVLIKSSLLTEPEKKKKLYALKEEMFNKIVSLHNESVQRRTPQRNSVVNMATSIDIDKRRMKEFAEIFKKSPLGSVFDY